MKIEEVHYQTFKSGSKTYFNSSRFFPADVRRDVFYLYAFVRKADNFVDEVPQDPDGFYRFCDSYRRSLEQTEHTKQAAQAGRTAQTDSSVSGPSGDPIIDRFVELH